MRIRKEGHMTRFENPVHLVLFGLLALGMIILAGCVPSAPDAANPTASVLPGNTPGSTAPAASQPGDYAIGNPVMTDVWVDPVHGDDARSGASRDQALLTITEAWNRIPQGTPLSGSGYRILLAGGDYPDSDFPLYWESRYGTADFPIIIQSADGPGKARLLGFVNFFDVCYVYLLDLALSTEGDVFHCEQCSHLLIRGASMNGGSGHQAHETIKINQSQYVYIENSDIFNTYENAIDFVSVQFGHITHNQLHDADDWCIYLKGGSAYFRIEGNEIYNCGTGGFSAGQGTGFEYMVSPWLHYEAYDIKFINNLVHDTQGAGMGVNGGYNILLSYNTLYRVGANSHAIEVVFGSRSCDGDVSRCNANLAAGGWGPTEPGMDGEPVPNRNVYIYNNILYNPSPFQSQWQHFAIFGSRNPSAGTNFPSPSVTDANLQIRGNLIWNGGSDMPLGIEDPSQGCQPTNPTCNSAQLLAENTINQIQPQFVDPANGDFHPSPGGSVFNTTTYDIPDFGWGDSPTKPSVPAGDLVNRVSIDFDGNIRVLPGIPGALGQ
jgi:hypothetical protein